MWGLGGKKLKDLTEEEIRQYAAQLSKVGREDQEEGSQESAGLSNGHASTNSGYPEQKKLDSGPKIVELQPADEEAVANIENMGRGDIARNIVKAHEERGPYVDPDPPPEMPGPKTAEEFFGLPPPDYEPPPRALPPPVEVTLDEAEQVRREVLSEMGRSQMPAVKAADSEVLIKTIEHYTFADSEASATVYVELDKDLFEGAAALVTEDKIHIRTKDNELELWLRGVPFAAHDGAPLADWHLHLRPLFHSVDPIGSVKKLRKGKVSVKLIKKKPQEWRKLLKY